MGMFSDITFIFYWWLLLFGLGIVFFPLTRLLFPKFFDRGYPLSKILGILIISYAVWILGSLKILPFLSETVWLIILFSAAGNFLLFNKNQKEIKKDVQENLKIFILEEIIFFFALTFWSFIRGFQPDIQGLEKFMDFGFINSILRSHYFPPSDMWLSGETINYYYFGHLTSAVLTKLSGIDPAITYNLMIATIFSLGFTSAFSLGTNLIFLTNSKSSSLKKGINIKAITGGFLTALLLTLGGNLHPLWWWITHKNFTSYWYPDATRFIVQLFGAVDNTIHEFPIYSFVVADLHGHLLDFPFVLLFLAITLHLLFQEKLSWYTKILIPLILGVLYITNAWDFPIYFAVLGLVALYLNCLRYGLRIKTLSKTLLFGIECFILAIIFSLPFHLNFKNIATGIAFVDFHSPLWMLPVLWGFPLFTTLTFFISLFVKKRTKPKISLPDVNYFIFILLVLSWALIVIPEIIYVKDIYIHSYQRANTMFKLTYQSFVMFSFASGFVIIKLFTSLKKSSAKFLYLIFLSPFLIFIFIYPYFAIRSYYGLKNYQGIYGLNFLKKLYPDDFQAVLWLNKNVVGLPVIAEAVGESYTDFARISANTGLPTLLGWRVHEWLWRGSFDTPGARTEEVKDIYESTDLAKTKGLLNKYQVKYIYLGDLERKQYPNLQEKKLDNLGELVFISGKTKLYKLP